jgi:RNA-binding protein
MRSRGQRMKARLVLGRKGLSEPFLAEVRAEFQRDELIKIRIEADDAEGTDRLAKELAAGVPCHLIQRIGRVALLYRQKPGSD